MNPHFFFPGFNESTHPLACIYLKPTRPPSSFPYKQAPSHLFIHGPTQRTSIFNECNLPTYSFMHESTRVLLLPSTYLPNDQQNKILANCYPAINIPTIFLSMCRNNASFFHQYIHPPISICILKLVVATSTCPPAHLLSIHEGTSPSAFR